jgi:hypothetical protein
MMTMMMILIGQTGSDWDGQIGLDSCVEYVLSAIFMKDGKF